ncbi:MAG: hypothetical protein HW387_410 [Parachlamydiales bacterium]|nr:hypothetical protein [Parachlamydiales bacterium]
MVIVNFLKCLAYNFLTVFFANYLLMGIEVEHPSKLPHIGGDLLFPLVLGLLFSSIYPILKVIDQNINLARIGIVAGCLSFGSYAILKFAPLGVEVKTVEGYLLASIVVALGGFLTNFFEMKRANKFPKPPEMPRMS